MLEKLKQNNAIWERGLLIIKEGIRYISLYQIRGAFRRPFCRFNVIAFSRAFALPTIIRFFEKPQNARLIEFLRSRRCGTVGRLSLG